MVRTTLSDGIAEIVLDAPDRLNALNADDIASLDAAYRAAEDAGVRALVLRGDGRAFCAGRAISGVDPRTDDVEGYLGGLVTPLLRRMSAFPAPTFAVAHGACLGVGLGLLIATDVVYVADTARIGSPFAKLGATLDSGGHALFYERLGAHKSLDLIYTGRLMSGEEAVASGLFSRVFPASDVVGATRDAARAVASGPTQAFLTSKALIASLRDERLDFWESLDAENRAQVALSDTDDYREGFSAFQQKREPTFTGGKRAG